MMAAVNLSPRKGSVFMEALAQTKNMNPAPQNWVFYGMKYSVSAIVISRGNSVLSSSPNSTKDTVSSHIPFPPHPEFSPHSVYFLLMCIGRGSSKVVLSLNLELFFSVICILQGSLKIKRKTLSDFCLALSWNWASACQDLLQMMEITGEFSCILYFFFVSRNLPQT